MARIGVGASGRVFGILTRTAGLVVFLASSAAFADVQSFPASTLPGQSSTDETASGGTTPGARVDAPRDVPIIAYTYSAFAAPAKSIGAAAYGLGLTAPGQNALIGGGGSAWWGPIDRLTLIADAQRNIYGNFSPSLAVVARILGDREAGWSLSGLGKFKIDGFASGPGHDEIESEVELGALVSFAAGGWFLDANAIAGRGTGDDGEVDAEGRLRFGKRLGEFLRLGVDSQVRERLAGPRILPNGRTWDFAAGVQGVASMGNYFASLTAGPATMGLLSSKVGWTALASVGGITF
jgi:hypothetical protein